MFKIAGVKFKLNLLFLLVLFLFSITGLFVKACFSFIVVFLHELAHAVIAYKKGVEVNEIELLPFGGVAKFRDLIQLAPKTEFQVSLAGPIFNFILAALTLLLIRYQMIASKQGLFFIKLNLIIGIFNLLPIFPLDGGRILRSKLTAKLGFKRATYQVLKWSKAIAFLIGILAMIGVYYGYTNITLLIICFFVYFTALKEGKYTPYVLMQYIAKKKGQVLNRQVVRVEELITYADTPIKEVIDCLVPNQFHTVLVVDNEFNKLGLVTEDRLIDALINDDLNLPIKRLV
ncbi:Zn-dependent protease [Halobacteroides halobius DSM 5150]|uniref:Zn-dependent protease n=1 Tax=Halobacteroides halobius (strain ATCC 35273 / DSM 5150 / MD-1) TaxID=748449 RepID=L0KA64_HALHC|nr:M50 family metallopeptidase [Halobacteroides halobius]AGB41886.1 Zn-dependent protease [Halobacteroides halobius DSM 5150]